MHYPQYVEEQLKMKLIKYQVVYELHKGEHIKTRPIKVHCELKLTSCQVTSHKVTLPGFNLTSKHFGGVTYCFVEDFLC